MYEYVIRGLVVNRDSHKCFLLGKELQLTPIERKMNLTKNRIILQKSDMLMAERRKNDLIMYLVHHQLFRFPTND